jgi:uncharacterized low-complexity protein
MMKVFMAAAITGATLLLVPFDAAAQTKSERCASYANNAMRSTPATTGVARGAARGAVGGAITGNVGRGAATGAAVAGTRKVVQKRRSYNYYYDQCMKR